MLLYTGLPVGMTVLPFDTLPEEFPFPYCCLKKYNKSVRVISYIKKTAPGPEALYQHAGFVS
jgi:hypothetical protein